MEVLPETPLCAKALEAGIEPDYVKNLIRRRHLDLEDPTQAVEEWPWPVKIYTLGRFALVREDNPVRFSGKVQKKPLELLKALIALGGRDVNTGKLLDFLWPDAAGDAAHRAFITTLQRLRRLLVTDALLYQDGRLTLDRLLISIGMAMTLIWAYSSPATAANNFSINGFFDLEYEKADGPGHSTTPVGDEKGSFDQYHFNLLMAFPIGDRLSVKGHVEYEHGPQLPGKGDIKVEWSYLEYLLNNNIRFRGGMMLTPFGIYNEIHDATPTYVSVRPRS